jgi:hypothetical protein
MNQVKWEIKEKKESGEIINKDVGPIGDRIFNSYISTKLN